MALAHKEGYFQEFLIYKPEERVWIHLNIDEKDAKIELLKRNFVSQILGQLYFIGMNSTFTVESEGRIFQQRNNLVSEKGISHLSFINMK